MPVKLVVFDLHFNRLRAKRGAPKLTARTLEDAADAVGEIQES